MNLWQLLSDNFLLQGLFLGILGGVHCVYMCTPLVLFITKKAGKLYVLTYHVGRIWAYSLLGMLAGAIGLMGTHWATFHYFSIAIGAVLIIHTLGIIKKIVWFKGPYNYLIRLAGTTKNDYFLRYFLVGTANGFLPCGLSATAIITSSITVKPFTGILFMLMFGIGTTLVLFASQWITKIVWFQKIKVNTNYVSILIGLFLIVRGLQLGIPLISPKELDTQNQHRVKLCTTVPKSK